ERRRITTPSGSTLRHAIPDRCDLHVFPSAGRLVAAGSRFRRNHRSVTPDPGGSARAARLPESGPAGARCDGPLAIVSVALEGRFSRPVRRVSAGPADPRTVLRPAKRGGYKHY